MDGKTLMKRSEETVLTFDQVSRAPVNDDMKHLLRCLWGNALGNHQ